MRVAVSTHVAEILRDAGPKVVFIPTHVLITLLLAWTLCHIGKTRQRNRQTHQGSQWKIRYVS